MSKQSLLLVDGDIRSLRVLEVSLRKAGFTITTATTAAEALDKVAQARPDLIISETKLEDRDGFALCKEVREQAGCADLPWVFLTSAGSIEDKVRGLQLGVDDYLTKPIYIKEIVTRLHILLQKRQRARLEERDDQRTRFVGRLTDMAVVDLIQTVEVSRKSGVIQFTGDNNRQAAIYFRDGKVIDAEAGPLHGEDAVYRLLTWSDGGFEVVFRTVRRREVIGVPTQGLLMEGMRRLDEWTRLLEQLPPLEVRFEVDGRELASRLGDIPDDHNALLKLLDGRRTLLEVIDASNVGDLETLMAVSRLYFEGILNESGPAPLDAATGLRDSGQWSLPRSVFEETPLQGSGPHGRARASSGPPPAMVPAALAPVTLGPAGAAPRRREPPAADAAGDADGLESTLRGTGQAVAPAPVAPPGAASPTEAMRLGQSGMFTLPSTFRPSGMRLVDEAVAAAEAIAPELVAALDDTGRITEPLQMGDTPLPRAPVRGKAPSDPPGAALARVKPPSKPPLTAPVVERTRTPSNPPRSGAQDRDAAPVKPSLEASAGGGEVIELALDDSDRTAVPAPEPSRRIRTSNGMERAQLSGEFRVPTPRDASDDGATARELITIQPRRITREFPAVVPTPADLAPAAAPTPGAEPAAEESSPRPRPSSRPPLPAASGTARGGVADPAIDDGEPRRWLPWAAAAFALALIVGAWRLGDRSRGGQAGSPGDAAPLTGAGLPAATDAGLAAPAFVDAGRAPAVDARPVGVDAAVVVAVRTADARPAFADAAVVAVRTADARPVGVDAAAVAASRVDAAPGPDYRALRTQAQAALDDGDLAAAIALADQSLAARHSVRAAMIKADALRRGNRADEALATLADAERRGELYPPLLELRGRILWGAGRVDEARAELRRFLELQPTGAAADRARAILDTGN